MLVIIATVSKRFSFLNWLFIVFSLSWMYALTWFIGYQHSSGTEFSVDLEILTIVDMVHRLSTHVEYWIICRSWNIDHSCARFLFCLRRKSKKSFFEASSSHRSSEVPSGCQAAKHITTASKALHVILYWLFIMFYNYFFMF